MTEHKLSTGPLDQWASGIKSPLIYIRFSLSSDLMLRLY